MESYPHHYSHRQKSDAIVDPTIRFILDELQKMETWVGNRIEGRCTDLEQHAAEMEQHVKECLISQEMARSKSKQGHAHPEKQFDRLKLEVHRMNHLLERETLANPHDKSGIITGSESAFASPSSDALAVSPDGHRVDSQPQDNEVG
jgi:hypothetical protein